MPEMCMDTVMVNETLDLIKMIVEVMGKFYDLADFIRFVPSAIRYSFKVYDNCRLSETQKYI